MSVQAEHSAAGGEVNSPPMVAVWDLFVRVFHWSLVAAFAVAWLTGEEMERLHEWVGYTAAGLVAGRLVWGIVGTKYARFCSFVKSPGATIVYLRDMTRGTEKRFLGHNPAGAAMILALLAGTLSLGLSGWMMTLDAFWGVKWVEETHEILANGMLALVALHILGVVIASKRHGENLVKSMITGKKRANP